ncbi:peptidase inhibitor family I36 protein [Streptomyces niveus]|uniref:Peptidase inhibitor family I36 n=1 Tax=Streptomyces niveus TaxID=193462 RepID=A0A1U9R174_STRNV|nr:peptidase inhibitor family I36 protein [Streptomyces niveus]AQU70256.1 hypothetical protein BBN63_32820 [Streptomyces niveus]
MIKKLALVLAMALAVGLPVAASASAADSPVREIRGHGLSACPKQSLCLYEKGDFNDADHDAKIWVVTGDVTDLSDYGADNEASSAYFNMTGKEATLFENTNQNTGDNGDEIDMAPTKRLASLDDQWGNYGGPYDYKRAIVHLNDAVSSVWFF